MGEVYRAKDTRLGRDVAVKVSAQQFSERFEREARVIASLNHTNVCHLYDVGHNYLVMELVEGQTLRGPLGFEEALPIVRQLIDGIEAAHEKNIVHRDLKPANIKITPEGVVKILDFGLAKASAPEPEGDPENSPTLTMGATTAGTILGTAAYMAPEQARGKTADKRCDIWFFGVVVYELLTGKRAFEGESVVETLGAVINLEPDWTAVPSRAQALLKWCLEKDRKRRLQSIGDARRMLDRVEEVAPTPARASKTWIAWAAVAALAGVAAWGWLRPKPEAPTAQSFTLTMVRPKGLNLTPVGSAGGAPLISPDGASVLAYSLLRNLNSLQMEPVRGMAGIGQEGFWSPDSKSVAFPVAGELRKVRIPDGAPEAIARLPGQTRGGTWSENGAILVAGADAGGWSLYLLPAGGSLNRVPVPGLPEGSYSHPEFLPVGSDFLFGFRPHGSDQGEIYLATLKNGQILNPTRLMQNDTAVHYTPAGGGRTLYVRNDYLYAQTLNLPERKLEGDAELIQQGVASAPGFALADFSVSRSGLVAWRPGARLLSQVTIFDREGKAVGTAGPPSHFVALHLSPDETHLLGLTEDRESQLLERDRPGLSGLGPVDWEVWSPDGLRLLGHQGSKIVERFVSGSGEVRTLAEAPDINFLEDVSPDGKIALYSTNKAGERSVYSVRLDTPGGGANTVVQTGEVILNARFSPDGRWVVYNAESADRRQLGIFVQPFPGPGLRRQVVGDGGFPVWRKDGKEIVYVGNGQRKRQVWSIPVNEAGSDLHFGSPVSLFEVRTLNLVAPANPLAVTRDGSRIFFPQAPEPSEDADVIHIRSGWEFKKP
jgi:hypothetical protein